MFSYNHTRFQEQFLLLQRNITLFSKETVKDFPIRHLKGWYSEDNVVGISRFVSLLTLIFLYQIQRNLNNSDCVCMF
jgi:hypothetical protein